MDAASSYRRSLFVGGIGLLLLAGCGETPEGPPEPPDPLSAAEEARALEAGASAAGALASGLVGQLTQAIEEGGPAGAVAFCAEDAISLTRRLQAEHDDRISVKRTTLRWRNPENAPDAWEERVLRYLEELEARDPEAVPGELTAGGPEGTLRYYRVLRVAPMCLSCHGPVESLDPEVRAILRTHYPDDRATGYEQGELRGVIRVEIPAG
jgi:hypothetical protein